ncbi:MAG TPA: hypothetical protein VMB27_26330 [Solirubrobacteraceae bacterium]|nr:hypothetical protein [Solirubrobacteraceae bacterium]
MKRSRRWCRGRALCATGLVGVVFVMLAASARADVPSRPDPDWVANGPVYAVARTASAVYLGGAFSQVSPRTGPFAVVSTDTGELRTPIPDVAGGSGIVDDEISDGNGGFYISGNFASVEGVPRTNLAHILADGTVDPSFDPTVSAEVYTLALEGSTLYIGGAFDSAADVDGTATRAYLAALDASTGAVSAWNPTGLNGLVQGMIATPTAVYVGGQFTAPRNYLAAFSPADASLLAWNPNPDFFAEPAAISGSTVYIDGWFSHVGGQSRESVAAVDATTGAVAGFNPIVGQNTVSAVAVSGTAVYLGGSFTTVVGAAHDYLEAVELGTGDALPWNPGVTGSVDALRLEGSTLYVGGAFSGSDSAGGADRNFAAAIDTTTGAATSWNPNANGLVNGIVPSGTSFGLTGQFSGLGGVARSNVAALSTSTGAVTAWNPDANGAVYAVQPAGSTVWIGGDFAGSGGVGGGSVARTGLAQVDATTGTLTTLYPGSIPNVRALALSGGTLYVGGEFTGTIGNGVNRDYLAAVNTADATVDTAFDPPAPSDFVDGLAVEGSTVYAVGNFGQAGASSRPNAAAFDAGTGALLPWNPAPDETSYTVVAAGGTVYLGGAFAHVDGTPQAGVAAVDATSGALLPWNPQLGNGTHGGVIEVHAIAVSGPDVFLGGDFDTVQGAVREELAEVDATTAAPTGWNPAEVNIIRQVDALAPDGAGGIAVGGQFLGFAQAAASYIATFSVPPTSTVVPDIAGTAAAGNVLTCGAGQWSGTMPQTNAVQWLRDGAPVTGATGAAYVVTTADAGGGLSCAVTATNLGGSATAESALVSVAPEPGSGGGGGPGGFGSAAPVLSALRISPAKFSLTGRIVNHRCVAATKGHDGNRRCRRAIRLRVSYTLSERATVTFTLKRLTAGREVKRRCVTPSAKDSKHKKCTRLVAVRGTIVMSGAAASNYLTFTGKIGGHTLGSGRYQLIATPTGGESRKVAFELRA